MFTRLQIRARWDERTTVCTVNVCKVYVRQQSPKRFRCRFSSRTETVSAATVNRRPGESTSCAVSRIGCEADWFWCRQPSRRLLLPPHGTKCHTRAVHRVTKACAASVEFFVKRVQLWSWFSWLQKWFEIITLPFGFIFFFFFFFACWDALVLLPACLSVSVIKVRLKFVYIGARGRRTGKQMRKKQKKKSTRLGLNKNVFETN